MTIEDIAKQNRVDAAKVKEMFEKEKIEHPDFNEQDVLRIVADHFRSNAVNESVSDEEWFKKYGERYGAEELEELKKWMKDNKLIERACNESKKLKEDASEPSLFMKMVKKLSESKELDISKIEDADGLMEAVKCAKELDEEKSGEVEALGNQYDRDPNVENLKAVWEKLADKPEAGVKLSPKCQEAIKEMLTDDSAEGIERVNGGNKGLDESTEDEVSYSKYNPDSYLDAQVLGMIDKIGKNKVESLGEQWYMVPSSEGVLVAEVDKGFTKVIQGVYIEPKDQKSGSALVGARTIAQGTEPEVLMSRAGQADEGLDEAKGNLDSSSEMIKARRFQGTVNDIINDTSMDIEEKKRLFRGEKEKFINSLSVKDEKYADDLLVKAIENMKDFVFGGDSVNEDTFESAKGQFSYGDRFYFLGSPEASREKIEQLLDKGQIVSFVGKDYFGGKPVSLNSNNKEKLDVIFGGNEGLDESTSADDVVSRGYRFFALKGEEFPDSMIGEAMAQMGSIYSMNAPSSVGYACNVSMSMKDPLDAIGYGERVYSKDLLDKVEYSLIILSPAIKHRDDIFNNLFSNGYEELSAERVSAGFDEYQDLLDEELMRDDEGLDEAADEDVMFSKLEAQAKKELEKLSDKELEKAFDVLASKGESGVDFERGYVIGQIIEDVLPGDILSYLGIKRVDGKSIDEAKGGISFMHLGDTNSKFSLAVDVNKYGQNFGEAKFTKPLYDVVVSKFGKGKFSGGQTSLESSKNPIEFHAKDGKGFVTTRTVKLVGDKYLLVRDSTGSMNEKPKTDVYEIKGSINESGLSESDDSITRYLEEIDVNPNDYATYEEWFEALDTALTHEQRDEGEDLSDYETILVEYYNSKKGNLAESYTEIDELADGADTKEKAIKELEYQLYNQGDFGIADKLGDKYVFKGILTDKERGAVIDKWKASKVNEATWDVTYLKDGKPVRKNVKTQTADMISAQKEFNQQGVDGEVILVKRVDESDKPDLTKYKPQIIAALKEFGVINLSNDEIDDALAGQRGGAVLALFAKDLISNGQLTVEDLNESKGEGEQGKEIEKQKGKEYYRITKDGEKQAEAASEKEALIKLRDIQQHSIHYATKYDGWNIERVRE